MTPNTEILRLLNGAVIWLSGLEGATAVTSQNVDLVGAVIDARGHQCADQVVRGCRSACPRQHWGLGVGHMYLELN